MKKFGFTQVLLITGMCFSFFTPICSGDVLFWNELPEAAIILDGNNDDWSGIDPLITDEQGDTTCDALRDVKSLSLARNADNIYWKLETWSGSYPTSGFIVSFTNQDGSSEVKVDISGDGDGAFNERFGNEAYSFLYHADATYTRTGEIAEGRFPATLFENREIIRVEAIYADWSISGVGCDYTDKYVYYDLSGDLNLSPAINLDGYGAAAWYNENGVFGLDFWCIVIDHDGIFSGSHTATVTFPDGHSEEMHFDGSSNETSAGFFLWKDISADDLELIRNSSAEFTFTVTDPKGNQGIAVDILDVTPLKALDKTAFSVTPNGTTPTFHWTNNVAGANTHRVRVYTDDLSRTVWKGYVGDVNQYTIPPGILTPHTTYRYRIDARDSHFGIDIDNVSRAPANNNENIQFTTGSETLIPFIDHDHAGVQTWNHIDVGSTLSPWIKVHHAGGVPENIKSVKVRYPDYTPENQHEERLYFSYNNSGTCGVYEGSSFLPLQEGDYTFVVEDINGNEARFVEFLSPNPLVSSDDWILQITSQPEGDGTGYHFAWDAVAGARFYRLEIYDRNYNRIYAFGTENTTYELKPGFLKKHELYRFRITARSEFIDQNVDNGMAMPWSSDNRVAMVTVPRTGGTQAPSIDLDSFGAVLYHYPHPTDGTERYYLGFSVKVEDGDGVPESIQSVTAQHGDNKWDIYYDGGSEGYGWYWRWVPVGDIDAAEGTYTFKVTDADGNVAQVADVLVVNPLPIPQGMKPAHGGSYYGTTPTIGWDPVVGASSYRVRIYNGLWNVLHKSDYMGEVKYTIPSGVLDLNQIFSYRVRACRENHLQDGVDLDNLSFSGAFAHTLLPHSTTRELDLGGAILSLQTAAGMNPENINAGADVSGDAKIGMEECSYALQMAGDAAVTRALVITFEPNDVVPVWNSNNGMWYHRLKYKVHNPNDFPVEVVAWGQFNECLSDIEECSVTPLQFKDWLTSCGEGSVYVPAKGYACDDYWWNRGYADNGDVTGRYAIWYKDQSGNLQVAISEELTLRQPPGGH